MKLPLKQTGFEQLNLGDKLGLGDLWQSFNCNFSKVLGTLLASTRMLLNINTDDDAQLSAPPSAFKAWLDDVWAAAGAVMWRNTAAGPDETFIQDVTADTPTNLNSDITDLCVAFSKMFVTKANTTVQYLDTSKAWNNATGTLANSSGNHQMTYFRTLNRVYVIDDNAAGVSSINSSGAITAVAASTQYTLNDLVEGAGAVAGSELSCITSNSTRIGLGTINRSGNNCRFYSWDGSLGGGGTYGPNEEYRIEASGVLSSIVLDDTFVIFTTTGVLMQLNGIGGTFVELARLPLEGASLKLPVSLATQRPVHFNGLSINEEGNIEILINTQIWNTGKVKENCPSGVWCYDRRTKNFYHKRSVGLSKSGGTITDYGASKLSLVGALAQVEVIDTDVIPNGKMMLGCDYYTTATVTKSGIFYDDFNDTLQKAALFTTQKIPSSQITDIWQKIYTMLGRKFLNSTDKVVVKARTEEDEPTEATITYTSTTTFNVPTASFTTAPAVGDEVEFLQGVGAGRTAHITVVTTSAPNYAITVDETITGATTQTAKARFQTWKKVGSYNAQTDDFFKFPFDVSQLGSTPWIQLRLWILWTGNNKLDSLILSSKPQEKIE